MSGWKDHAELTRNPLNPDDVVSSRGRCEFLEAFAVIHLYSVLLALQVVWHLSQEILHHIHQLHTLENRQQDVLADPTYPTAAVQGAAGASFPHPLWDTRKLFEI